MKAVLLCPAEDYPETYDWAYDNQAEALEAAGFEVIGRRWTDDAPEADADIVLPLVAWGYHHRIDQWHALLDRLEAACVAVLNPVPLLRWNSDKAYLTELGAAGVPTVATIAVGALDDAALAEARARFATTELVVKPPVSAAADGTYRVAAGEEVPEAVRGRRMLIQPFQRAISTQGELSLLLFGGELSHALIKRPKPGDYRVQPHLGGTETLVEAPSEALDLAHRALAAAPAPATYARVDMIADEAGAWQIMELELIEPALWLPRAPGSAERFAAAVAAQAEQILAQR
jgi:glutathione synthase/RimK-type ligase-like ATP-grasp enzyme